MLHFIPATIIEFNTVQEMKLNDNYKYETRKLMQATVQKKQS